MNEQASPRRGLDEGTFFWGAILGFALGVIAWLWRVPQRGTETRQQIINSGKELIEQDSLEDSLAEGRAIARLRQNSDAEATDVG